LRVNIWAESTFDIPSRPDSQAVARQPLALEVMQEFLRLAYGTLNQDPLYPVTTTEGANQILNPKLVVVHSPGY
jgi:hypothetical protein